MARVSTYLNFHRETAAAFEFYRSVFGTEYITPPMRFGDLPPSDDMPLADSDRDLIMNVQLPTVGGHTIMGTDAPESMGMACNFGNNVTLQLHVDSTQEADRLFTALSEGGKVAMPIQTMFWGDYWGQLIDKFGIQWMVTTAA